MGTSPLRASDVVGAPMLPPPFLAHVVGAARSALGRALGSASPPPVQILEGVLGLIDHRVLVALCEAGVPEALTGPRSVSELASAVDADPVLLERLVRFAATRGWLRIDRRGRVRPTRVTSFLRSDHPGGWRAYVDLAGGDEVVAAVSALSLRGRVADPFEAAHGAGFFEWLAEHPDRRTVFDRAMAASARLHALSLHSALDWDAVDTVCDVGGGTGELLSTLLDLEPHLSGTLLEVPAAAAGARRHERLTVIAGDAFEQVPAGNDVYLLVNVVHNWGDEAVERVLSRVADVVGGGTVYVVDSLRPRRPRRDVAAGIDVLMAALTPGGRERDAGDLAALGARAGLRLVRSVRLASTSLAHELRR